MQSFQTARRRSSLLWVFFGLSGRISRQVYWLAYAFLLSINSALIGQLFGGEQASFHALAQAVAPPALIATFFTNIAIAVKRLHDVGWAGFFAFLLVVPIVNFGFTIWIGILPGTAGPNQFGAAPDVPPP